MIKGTEPYNGGDHAAVGQSHYDSFYSECLVHLLNVVLIEFSEFNVSIYLDLLKQR